METPLAQPIPQTQPAQETAQETQPKELLLVEIMNGITFSAVVMMMSVVFFSFGELVTAPF